nr:cytochrome P450 9e2-like [Leptinotarsa decemlineata]
MAETILAIFAVAIIAMATFYYYFVRPMYYWRKRGVPQETPKWMFGDNFRNVMGLESIPIIMDNIYKKVNARYHGFYQFTRPTLLIKDPELLKQVMVKYFDHFTDRRKFLSEEVDPLWGRNMVELTGDKWRNLRAATTPIFTSGRMKILFQTILNVTETFVEFFSKKDEAVIELDIKETMNHYCSDIIASIAFGVTVDSMRNPDDEFYLMSKEATNIHSTRAKIAFFSSLLLPDYVMKFLGIKMFSTRVSKFFTEVLNESIKMRREGKTARTDLIQILLDTNKDGREIRNEDILAQAMLYISGGFETISGVLVFMCYELAMNKNIQETLRKEILEVNKSNNGKLTYSCILEMKYMDMVFSESLRIHPVISGFERTCTETYTIEPATIDEPPLVIEKGILVWIPLYSLHHDPEYFENPYKFDPERFNDENKNKIEPYQYMPFGMGPRNCPSIRFGMITVKTLIFYLLLNFEISPTDRTPNPIRYRKKSMFLAPEKRIFFNMTKLHT